MLPTEDLETRIEQYDLHPVKDYALKNMVAVLTFALGEAAPEPHASRVGGEPHLPPSIEWPTMNGQPMIFVAQINLAEATPHDPYGLLPTDGMLYFFFGNDEPSTHMPHRVFLVEDTTTLTPVTPSSPPLYTRTNPHLFGADAQSLNPFHPFGLIPRPGLNIPPLSYAEEALDALTDSIEDDEQAEVLPEVYDMLARETDGNWICKTYGYPEEYNGDLEYEAALRIHADQTYDCFKDSAVEALAACFDGDKARAIKVIRDTVLLLEVRSDCHTGFMWGNNGVIHFFIDREDLQNRRFDRTFCSLTYN